MKSIYAPEYRRTLARLRAARTAAGVTQAQVAERLGRTQSFVSKCESGERRIDPTELAAFASLYGKRRVLGLSATSPGLGPLG